MSAWFIRLLCKWDTNMKNVLLLTAYEKCQKYIEELFLNASGDPYVNFHNLKKFIENSYSAGGAFTVGATKDEYEMIYKNYGAVILGMYKAVGDLYSDLQTAILINRRVITKETHEPIKKEAEELMRFVERSYTNYLARVNIEML